MAFEKVKSSIPFVTTVQIECGYIQSENVKTLPKTLFLDTHCVQCYRAIINSKNTKIFNQVPNCDGNINAYILSGALHYNMRFGNFLREGNLTTSAPNSLTNISFSQSICVNNLIAYTCSGNLEESNDLILTSYKFTPRFKVFKLYSDEYLEGINLYSNIDDSILTAEAVRALNYPTGCKSVVITGYIDINV
ncbi:MAG: hypothetical protein ACRCTZ_01280 [Sarcina sp.]